ncbi:MAG: phenylalanine--tRNA ligase subunit beta [Actinobacteria bacterium]|nr:phenylalanine--tRNA ligase subunit beta [Actinomycetota bacterium]
MLVPISWLKEYIDFELSPDELAEQLNLTGTAVESIKHLGEGLENVRVGQLIDVKPHPDADKLSVTTVYIGRPETLQIICGAKNIKTGDKVPVALIGAHLPNGVEIKAAKIRGVTSQGMLCSQAELKVGSDASGIYILPRDVEVGVPFAQAMGLDDTILDLEITPNRPDSLAMIGIAREVGAITGNKLHKPIVSLRESTEKAADVTGVEILDPDLCPRYTARLIRGVKVGPSPTWMRQRLQKAGMRPINNIVDTTNYVMLETGQPLHAFDFDTLHGRRIIVRKAKNGEHLTTLDGVIRELDESMLVIADAQRPVALGGIMGGGDTEVSEKTVDILLESAYFEPKSIMRTSRNLGLLSEASARFEKGADPNGVVYAADRAAQLMAEIAGGSVSQGIIDAYPKAIRPRRLPLRTDRVNAILGTRLSLEEIINILKRLELSVEIVEGTTDMWVTIPTFRPDLEREIDLIEEVARIYGYNNIESTLPESSGKQGGLNLRQRIAESVKGRLVASGLSEIITYSFIDPRDVDKLQIPEGDPFRWFVRLMNPLSEGLSVLRTTLLANLLKVLKYNVNRGQYDVQVFEIGHVFWHEEGKELPDEETMLGIALTGAWRPDEWYEKGRAIDFFDLKGVIDSVMDEINVTNLSVRQFTHPALHPGRSAELLIGDESIGFFGELHPDAQAAFDMPRAYVAELNFNKLIDKARVEKIFVEIPKYPAISLDIAVLVDESVIHEQLVELIEAEGKPILEQARLFDLYTGKGVPEGKKSMAYSMIFRAPGRTLTDEEALEARERIVNRLSKELGAEIRA